VRFRVGVLLWLLSWVPYGVILGLHHPWLQVTWAVELTMGAVGLALAGTAFAAAVKTAGWRGAPAVAWNSLRGHGPVDPSADAVVEPP
jgi:hypothetical protein